MYISVRYKDTRCDNVVVFIGDSWFVFLLPAVVQDPYWSLVVQVAQESDNHSQVKEDRRVKIVSDTGLMFLLVSGPDPL